MWLWTVGSCIHMHSTTTISRSTSSVSWNVQGGAEPTDTFQMVIDNIWKQGKISETVYKYVQVCYLLPHRLQAYFLNIRQMTFVYINALLQACPEVAVHAPP